MPDRRPQNSPVSSSSTLAYLAAVATSAHPCVAHIASCTQIYEERNRMRTTRSETRNRAGCIARRYAFKLKRQRGVAKKQYRFSSYR